jgi:hypothetical protein
MRSAKLRIAVWTLAPAAILLPLLTAERLDEYEWRRWPFRQRVVTHLAARSMPRDRLHINKSDLGLLRLEETGLDEVSPRPYDGYSSGSKA